jgi:hypothetical protein
MNNQLLVKMVLDGWNAKLKETDALLAQLSDEQLMNEVAPGRNRGIYLLGHLTAVNDKMISLLNLGEQLHPELNDSFLKEADKKTDEITSADVLRKCWNEINSVLTNHFNNMQPESWFEKHTSVSAEDFAKEPHRNKLNIIISRTNHLAYHLGQMALLKK